MKDIEELEIWNWESWEHALFTDFAPGLNMICGESNTGKTSIVRFIKFIAHNDFNPKSVRLGADNCMGRIKTHRGEVKVTRGKDNIWEVTPKGQPTQIFERIGKEVLPQAAEIIGLGLVQLGDVEISANIMDQLEGHFMGRLVLLGAIHGGRRPHAQKLGQTVALSHGRPELRLR